MPTPQSGIFAPTQPHQYALEFRLLTDCDNAAIAGAIAAIDTEFRTHARGATHVVALGPDLCRMLEIGSSPECRPFQAMDGTGGTSVPALQNDLLLWIQGPSPDVLFDLAMAACKALVPVMRLALEVPGFVYHDSRDLTGFIDGSANPTGALIRETALSANGAAHVELCTLPDGRQILFEIGLRCGGGVTAHPVAELVTGLNQMVEYVEILAGNKDRNIAPLFNNGASFQFISAKPGHVKNIDGFEEAAALPGINSACLTVKPGDTIQALKTSSQRLGYFVATGKTNEEAYRLGLEAQNRLRFVYEDDRHQTG